MMPKFGPAGQCLLAKERRIKSTVQYLSMLSEMGLTAFEYQCGRGVNIGEEKALEIGGQARQLGILVSLHAPYYISLAALEEEKRLASVRYILQSGRAIHALGGTRIVVHPGGLLKQTRAEALAAARETLLAAQRELDAEGLSDVVICPETMGKVSQLGDLDEVLSLCSLDERMVPCIDFGHMNARTQGGACTKENFLAMLNRMEDVLGAERVKHFHAHFSKIEYSAGGEVRHLTFEDRQYGPDFEPLLESIVQKGLSPTIICESAGTQSQDALTMQNACKSLMGV